MCGKSKSGVPLHILDILLPHRMVFPWPVVRGPDWFSNEEPHELDIVVAVDDEPMINPSWQDDHVSLFYPNPNPFVILVTDIKVTATLQAVPDLFISMNVLTIEALQLLLIIFNLSGHISVRSK